MKISKHTSQFRALSKLERAIQNFMAWVASLTAEDSALLALWFLLIVLEFYWYRLVR